MPNRTRARPIYDPRARHLKLYGANDSGHHQLVPLDTDPAMLFWLGITFFNGARVAHRGEDVRHNHMRCTALPYDNVDIAIHAFGLAFTPEKIGVMGPALQLWPVVARNMRASGQ